MEYYEAVNRLEGLRRLRPKLGTETTESLLSIHGNPHADITAVQIAGSNGKGSTARLLDGILREAGLTVGLYISPDLNDLRERIRVQGQKIPKHDVSRFVSETWPTIIEHAAAGDAPTFFEAATAMALWHFEREGVDVAVLEVGIGGQYDATSVVDPIASAVTTVSLEHTDILGSTVTEIARDKAQVAPADGPLVTGARGEALQTIRELTDVVVVRDDTERHEVEEGQAEPDVWATENGMHSTTEASLSIRGPDWTVQTRTSLLGRHQAENAGIAATLARQVGRRYDDATVDTEDVAVGIRNVDWPGRFEIMQQQPLVVLDGAHNPDASQRLADLLDRFDYEELRLVFGAMREKDHAEMVRALSPLDHVFLGEPDVDRAADTEILQAVIERTTDTTITRANSILGALDAALDGAEPDDCVLVTGSLYTVAEARDRWTGRPREVETGTTQAAREVLSRADVPAVARDRSESHLVHRTVQLRVRRPVARVLSETMLTVGGTCSISGIETADEQVGVVLGGTLAQFDRLGTRLEQQSEYGYLARQLQRLLDTNSPKSTTASRHPWDDHPVVMGILNVTPDSFYDGGEYERVETAVEHAKEMVEGGAEIIDIGGESTRPGAEPTPVETERDRVVPVVEALADVDVELSVDTRKPAVARAALEAGADIINDVTGLADVEMRDVVAEWDVPVVLMHSLGAPVDPTRSYEYDDVVETVHETLTERLLVAERAGVDRSNIIVDPGLGFGKAAPESFTLLDRLTELQALDVPILVGHSRKSMFADLPHSDDRLAHTVSGTALAVDRGADIIRVHDVPENVAAVATAVRTTGKLP